METQERYGRGQGEGYNNRPDDLGGHDRRASETGSGNEQECPRCLKSFKKLSSHMRWCKDSSALIIDDFTEKRLSSVILEIEEVLKSYINEMDIHVKKANGDFKEVTLTARFQVRR